MFRPSEICFLICDDNKPVYGPLATHLEKLNSLCLFKISLKTLSFINPAHRTYTTKSALLIIHV